MTVGIKKQMINRLSVFIFFATILYLSCTNLQNSPKPTPLNSYNMSAYASGEFLTFNAFCSNDGDSILSIMGEWTTNISADYDLNFYNIKNTKNYIGTYTLNTSPNAEYHAVQIPTSGSYLFAYSTDATHTGSLSITAYDSINKTISGTFNFIGTGCSNCNTSSPAVINITNGVFTKVPL